MLAGPNTIYLRDGRTISGRFLSGSSDSVSFQDDSGNPYRFRTSEVQSILFGGTGPGYNGFSNGPNDPQRYDPNSPRNNPNNGNFGNNDARYNQRNGNFNNAGGVDRNLPAGTELAVRTTSVISSKDANDGQIFPATIDRDVMGQNGDVVIPRGSMADLIIRSTNGGSIRSSSNLVLDIQDVVVNGQKFMISTQDVQRSGRDGIGGNRRTAEIVGGGTALGTLLGAIGGGGKGALIGALAGAAAGAGVQVLTKGGEVRVPSETVLTFRLDQPMNMSSTGY